MLDPVDWVGRDVVEVDPLKKTLAFKRWTDEGMTPVEAPLDWRQQFLRYAAQGYTPVRVQGTS